ncbi:MAG: DNA-directed RNA polymerase, subunit E'' [Methanimicrococcus sp.]|nr:DNA-directed RNA polymerase, subunit E'' [Methanimicrococcus sp.]MCL2141374.1 DNA-directed RNA polymerase, subunit E'' [Methanimicrococcus sp.]
MAEKVCRKCMRLVNAEKCEICESTDLAEEWFGLLVVVDPLKSEIAKRMNYNLADKYALKVR